MVAARQERRKRYCSPVDDPTLGAIARQRREIVAVDPPFDALTFLGLDGAFEIGVGLSKRDLDLADGGVFDDRHGFHDALDAGAAPAPQYSGRIAGLADRHVESVQHGEDDFWIGSPADSCRVHVLEHDARIGREAPQSSRDMRSRRHGISQTTR